MGQIGPTALEQEFSWTFVICNILHNHNIIHISWFPAKSNDKNFCKSPKTLILGHFGPNWAHSSEQEFSWTFVICSILHNHNIIHTSWFSAKSNDKNFCKSQKTLILGHFGPIWPKFRGFRIFLKKRARHFSILMIL